MDELNDELKAALRGTDLEQMNQLEKETILNQIAAIVADMLETQPDLLFSYLYRLDVDEHKISKVVNQGPGGDISLGLATLILQRQLARIQTQKEYGKR